MPLDVITGPGFSGKRRFALQEVEERERDGEVGLLVLDFTALYLAIAPGEQSQYRDEEIADSGAARMAGYGLAVLTRTAIERELSGFVTTNSARQAVELATRTGGRIYEVQVSVDALADRLAAHEADIKRRVPRARRDASRLSRRCRESAKVYAREAPHLDGRTVTPVEQAGRRYRAGRPRRGSGYAADGEWIENLSAKGRRAFNKLVKAGNPSPSFEDVLAEVL